MEPCSVEAKRGKQPTRQLAALANSGDLALPKSKACFQSNMLADGCVTVSHGTIFTLQGSLFRLDLAGSSGCMTVSMYKGRLAHALGWLVRSMGWGSLIGLLAICNLGLKIQSQQHGHASNLQPSCRNDISIRVKYAARGMSLAIASSSSTTTRSRYQAAGISKRMSAIAKSKNEQNDHEIRPLYSVSIVAS